MDPTLIKLTAHKFDAEKFYDILFQRVPELRKRFPENMERHLGVFSRTIKLVVANADDLSAIDPALKMLGRRHTSLYEAKPAEFQLVGEVLIESLELETDAQKKSWQEFYGELLRRMQVEIPTATE